MSTREFTEADYDSFDDEPNVLVNPHVCRFNVYVLTNTDNGIRLTDHTTSPARIIGTIDGHGIHRGSLPTHIQSVVSRFKSHMIGDVSSVAHDDEVIHVCTSVPVTVDYSQDIETLTSLVTRFRALGEEQLVNKLSVIIHDLRWRNAK